jgi:hypothetical protein
MNYYYEIADQVTVFGSNHKYWVQRDIDKKHGSAGFHFDVMLNSNRTWREDGKEVRFVKNRFYDPNKTEVDFEEFLLVKLSARSFP